MLSSDLLRRTMLVGLLSPLAPALAESLPELIVRCRRAVVAVGSFSALRSPRFGFSGSGFVIGDGTMVATCFHVIPDFGVTTERVELVVQIQSDSGGPAWRRAKVLSQDRNRDLCILKIEGEPLPPLAISERQSIDAAEGTSVVLMGFPIGGALGYSVVSHHGIVSSIVGSTAPATSAGLLTDKAILGAREGAFELLQLDATAYPGNSGGPLINATNGNVIGVVSMVLVKGTRESALSTPTGITYAVPSKYLASLMKKT